MKRVVLKRKDPAKTKVIEVMSKTDCYGETTHNDNTCHTDNIIKQKIKKLAVINADHLVGILSLTNLIPLQETKSINKLSLKGAPKRMKKIFEIYYDSKRQRRKNCRLAIARGMAISCLGSKCMQYVTDRCVLLTLVEKIAS